MPGDDMMTAVGVMSGTSMDAIDVAVIRTDGRLAVAAGKAAAYPYEPGLRAALGRFVAEGALAGSDEASLEAAVTEAHAEAVLRFLADSGLDRSAIDVVGFHGQTVLHKPRQGFTRQLGNGQRWADLLGIPVVNRFRQADVAAGGEGAPLVPLYHQALASDFAQPLVVLNLGGVANITYLDGDTVIACDTGPASALLDDFVLQRTGNAFDRDGALAASGQVDRQVLATLLDNPFFSRPTPKSLDRQAFHERAGVVEILSNADGAATLAAFTVEATARIVDHLPRRPLRWLVTGGGRLNLTFMRLFEARLGVPVEPVETVGWQGDALEAQCFGYLAVRSLRGLPLSLPTTTGVPAQGRPGRTRPATW